MKPLFKLMSLAAVACLFSGCQFYKPGNISKSFFGGLSEDGAILRMPTPWGPAIRVGDTTNSVSISPDGTIQINMPAK